jgi:hypothetical protein
LQPLTLDDLVVLGFSPQAWHAELAEQLPGRFLLTGELDPAPGSAGAHGMVARVRRRDLRRLHLVPPRRPDARIRLAELWLRRVLPRGSPGQASCTSAWARARRGPACPDWAIRLGAASAPSAAPARPRWPAWPSRCVPVPRSPVSGRAARSATVHGVDAGELRELAGALPRVQFVLGAACLPTAQLCRLARLPNVHVLVTDLLAGLRVCRVEAARALGEASCWWRSAPTGCCSAVVTAVPAWPAGRGVRTCPRPC